MYKCGNHKYLLKVDLKVTIELMKWELKCSRKMILIYKIGNSNYLTLCKKNKYISCIRFFLPDIMHLFGLKSLGWYLCLSVVYHLNSFNFFCKTKYIVLLTTSWWISGFCMTPFDLCNLFLKLINLTERTKI